jgi:small-conductance mechanosensitive channel
MKTIAEWFTTLSGFLDSINDQFGDKWTYALLVLIIALIFSRLLQKAVDRHLAHDDQSDELTIRAYKKMARFVVMAPGILLAVHVLGINMSSVFTTSGLFAVAIGFAMKNGIENYMSGIMIRVERSIKPGDVLEFEGLMIRVKKIGFRGTIARSKDEKDILIPNSLLLQQRIANYTFRDPLCRVWTFVGVAYSSDLNKTREVLESVCDNFAGLSERHAPQVLLTDFGASSVNYKISIWVEDPWQSGLIKSNLNEAIWRGLNAANIVIAYPQLDVHFDNHSTPGKMSGTNLQETPDNHGKA